MIKRTVTTTLLGLALAAHAALAQDVRTPAPGPDRTAQAAQMSDDAKRAAQKTLDAYWATHNDNAPAYPFNP
jgi:hypothetical protein